MVIPHSHHGKDTRIRPIQTAFQLFNPLSLVAADYPTSLPAFLCLSLSISFSSSFSLFSLLSDWDGFLLYLLTTRSWYYRHTHLHSHSLYHHHHHHHYTTFLSLSLSLPLLPLLFTASIHCIYTVYTIPCRGSAIQPWGNPGWKYDNPVIHVFLFPPGLAYVIGWTPPEYGLFSTPSSFLHHQIFVDLIIYSFTTAITEHYVLCTVCWLDQETEKVRSLFLFFSFLFFFTPSRIIIPSAPSPLLLHHYHYYPYIQTYIHRF